MHLGLALVSGISPNETLHLNVKQLALSAETAPRAAGVRVDQTSVLHRAGYWAVIVLALSLPFEATQRPVIHTTHLTVTNLKIVLYLVVALAGASLARPFLDLGRAILARTHDPNNYLYRQRAVLTVFASLLMASVVSSLLSHHVEQGLKWTVDLAMGGLLWLAMPMWLAEGTDQKIRRIGLALVAGAVIAALVGFLELILGARFDESLVWFKAKPTTAGSFLRLSGTFLYANVAAMYFELALPFALVAMVGSLDRRGVTRTRVPDTPAASTQTVPRTSPQRWVAVLVGLLAIDVLLSALLLTYTRGAWLGLFVGLVVMALATRRTRWFRTTRHIRWWGLAVAANVALVVISVVASSGALVTLRLTSQSDQDWYRAAYTSAVSPRMTADQTKRWSVTVKNIGPLTWNASGLHPFQLSYHWLFASKKMAEFDGTRTGLASSVAPGGTQTVLARVRTPCAPGHYLLVWDMVQDGVTWFSLKSATYRTIPVLVGESQRAKPGVGAGPRACPPITVRDRLQPTFLPTTVSEPPRQRLWPAALAMVRAHPLFGVGPDGYRLSYGAFTTPRLSSWDTRILANNLMLELSADLGLVGGGLFLAFLLVVAWPVILGVWRGQGLTWWELALAGALAAFLGHGLVDYILKADAIFILFWLLCGLAATSRLIQSRPVESV